ncbi:hypothetical protein FG379_001812 [Cryptosporidium bovis]|uniref:uncharacterized protein n=1 Tax=Cryptosporidium bovis TaxID=310047 RepID=UPI00351AAD31|nr:hypothetical protein FG379_001812 [Cryptosporidium bovis]
MDIGDVGRMLISVSKKVKKTASQIVNPLTPLEKLLKEATSNTNWGCSSTILNEISRSMVDYHDYIVIQHCICDCLNQKPSKWRKIYKTLILIEYLLKNGIERFIDDTKENVYRIRNLQDFYYSEEGRDKGAGIREKSKYILNLLNDPLVLKNERKKAKDNRGKYIGINSKCSNSSVSSTCYYGNKYSGGITGTGGGGVGLGTNRPDKLGSVNYSSCRKELYDPYKPQQSSSDSIDCKNNNASINDSTLKSKPKPSDNASFSSSTSLHALPPLPSSLNNSNKNSGIIRINNVYNNNNIRNKSTEPDKYILAATSILARQDEKYVRNNINPFRESLENSMSNNSTSKLNDDNDNPPISEWCDFIGANNNEKTNNKMNKTSNPFNTEFEDKIQESKTSDLNNGGSSGDIINKKKVMESLDLLDVLSLSNDNTNTCMGGLDYIKNDCNNGVNNNNVHIPFGF